MARYQIGVSDFIRQLRSDLEEAIDEEAGIRFEVEDLEVELRVVATYGGETKGGGQGGFKLWVFSAEAGGEAKAAYESSRTQTVRLKLRPQNRLETEGGEATYEDDVLLSGTPSGDG